MVVARHERLRIRRDIGLRLARAERLLAANGCPSSSPPSSKLLVAARLELLIVAAAPSGRAAGNSDFAGGTAPARPRSGGNNVRHAESNFPPRPDRRRTGRRAQAGDISPPRDWPFRGSSHQGRWIHRPVSAGCDCGGCYCCCCYCCARACACCDDAADRFSWLVVQQLLICRGSDPPASFPASSGVDAGTKNPLARCRHRGGRARTSRAFRRRSWSRCLNILNPPRPCRSMAHPLVMRLAGLKPGMRSTGESFRIPMRRSVVSPKRKFPHSPCPHRRLTEPRSGPLVAVRHPIWDRFRELTLIGLLRHSKRFFGLSDPSGTVPYCH